VGGGCANVDGQPLPFVPRDNSRYFDVNANLNF
jgi:hypothetical protein